MDEVTGDRTLWDAVPPEGGPASSKWEVPRRRTG